MTEKSLKIVVEGAEYPISCGAFKSMLELAVIGQTKEPIPMLEFSSHMGEFSAVLGAVNKPDEVACPILQASADNDVYLALLKVPSRLLLPDNPDVFARNISGASIQKVYYYPDRTVGLEVIEHSTVTNPRSILSPSHIDRDILITELKLCEGVGVRVEINKRLKIVETSSLGTSVDADPFAIDLLINKDC